MSEDLKSELQPLCDEWTKCFAVNDFDGVRNLWMPDLEHPYYVAEEHAVLMTSWDELNHYWAETAKINKDFSGGMTIMNAKQTSADQAMVQFELWWKMSLEGWERPAGGVNRGMAGFGRTPDGWRFHSYIEAPLAPIIYFEAHQTDEAALAELRRVYMSVAETLGDS